MNKQITTEQVNVLLHTIYQTNISAQTLDAVKKMLLELPNVEIDFAKGAIDDSKLKDNKK